MATGLYQRITDIVRAAYSRRIATPAVLDAASYFPANVAFAGMWETLRAEALTLAEGFGQIPRFHEIMEEQAPISDNDGRDWPGRASTSPSTTVRSAACCASTLDCPCPSPPTASRQS
jgi:hypothetical protein